MKCAFRRLSPKVKGKSQRFRCDPIALSILAARSTTNGFSLAQLKGLAADVGLRYQMAKRSAGSSVPLNSIVHWKLNHFGAVIGEKNGRYLIQDGTFSRLYGQTLWMSKAALEEESSGYFLIPDGALPPGWISIADDVGSSVWGKGPTAGQDPNALTDCDTKSCPNSNPFAMAQYSIHLMLVSLNIADIPIGYTPPRGPAVNFRVVYNQRDPHAASDANYSNLGSKWTFEWNSFIDDQDTGDGGTVRRYLSGGGMLVHSNPDSGGEYDPDRDGAILRYSANDDRYELEHSDGSKLIYGIRLSADRVHLTAVKDPAGNTLQIIYDTDGRVWRIKDALNQTTILQYELPGNKYRITRVIDPFQREARFEYDTFGRLKKITDVIGMSSSFTYSSTEAFDAVAQMSTPYGTTTFEAGQNGYDRWLKVTDPEGQREYAYSTHTPPISIPSSETEAPTAPQGYPSFANYTLNYRNTFYLDKKAMQESGQNPDYSKATIYHWCYDDVTGPGSLTSGILESLKRPLENRVWFLYPGQSFDGKFITGMTLRKPAVIARVVQDPDNPNATKTQAHILQYNHRGAITKYIDPKGRETSFGYYQTGGIDGPNLHTVKQTKDAQGNGINELLAEYGQYNSAHRPSSFIDAARQTYGLVWTATGLLERVDKPNGEKVYLEYDPQGLGYLMTVKQPWSGGWKATTFTYDSKARIRTVTDSDNYTLTYDYDALDRVIRVTYPDQTFERFVYSRLDLTDTFDRAGQRTEIEYDAVGRPTALIDRLQQRTEFGWCDCGDLTEIKDPRGHTTAWQRDLQGRVTKKTYQKRRRQWGRV